MARSRGRWGSGGTRESRCFAGAYYNRISVEDPNGRHDISVLNMKDYRQHNNSLVAVVSLLRSLFILVYSSSKCFSSVDMGAWFCRKSCSC